MDERLGRIEKMLVSERRENVKKDGTPAFADARTTAKAELTDRLSSIYFSTSKSTRKHINLFIGLEGDDSTTATTHQIQRISDLQDLEPFLVHRGAIQEPHLIEDIISTDPLAAAANDVSFESLTNSLRSLSDNTPEEKRLR